MLVKICGNWKDVLATRRDNVNVCYLNGCDLFEKVRYSKRCVSQSDLQWFQFDISTWQKQY